MQQDVYHTQKHINKKPQCCLKQLNVCEGLCGREAQTHCTRTSEKRCKLPSRQPCMCTGLPNGAEGIKGPQSSSEKYI